MAAMTTRGPKQQADNLMDIQRPLAAREGARNHNPTSWVPKHSANELDPREGHPRLPIQAHTMTKHSQIKHQ